MQNDNGMLTQRYRSLVLTHAYIIARGRDVPIGRLPGAMLGRLGIEKITGCAGGTTFLVRIPDDLGSPAVAGRMGRYEREARENRHLFPRPPAKEDGGGEGGKACGEDGRDAAFRPRRKAGKKAVEEFDVEPLDEKALLRMASAP